MVCLFLDSMRISISHTIRRIYAIILRCAEPPCPLFNLSVNLQSRQKQRCSLNYKRAQKESRKNKRVPAECRQPRRLDHQFLHKLRERCSKRGVVRERRRRWHRQERHLHERLNEDEGRRKCNKRINKLTVTNDHNSSCGRRGGWAVCP
jgi:hypothetical protein